jgi:hypothetical protein
MIRITPSAELTVAAMQLAFRYVCMSSLLTDECHTLEHPVVNKELLHTLASILTNGM